MKFYRLPQNIVYLLTFALCLAISAIITWQAYNWQRNANYDSFRYTSRENFFFMKKALEWHEEFVVRLSNYFIHSAEITHAHSIEITHAEFTFYTDFNVSSFNFFDVLGWVESQPDGQYRLKFINTENGFKPNDIASINANPLFRQYLDIARKNQKPAYFIDNTGIISSNGKNHILIIHPAFKDKNAPDSLIGFSFTTIEVKNLVLTSVGELNPYIHLSVSALTAENQEIHLYESDIPGVDSDFYDREKLLEFPGLTLTFDFSVTQEFLKEHSLTKTYIFFIGIYLFLCALALLYFRQMNSHIDKIREAQHKAEESNRLKNDFLATMSHEIRSPMSGVLGMAELLLGTNLTADQKGYTETILNSGEVLLNIIEDILDVSKIEANKLKIDPIAVNMVDLVDDVCALYACKSQEKAVELAVRYIPGSEQFVYADPVRVRQVLGNLINNAIKFTEKGNVTVTVREDRNAAMSREETRLVFSVEDTGVGISKDAQERIFEQFMQADSSTTRNYGGTGLGLTISKKLVELMGGEISVESEPGRGSIFTFSLTLQRNSDERVPYPNPPILKGVKILIVDDFSVIGHVLKENLGLINMDCQWESDALAVLPLLKAAKAQGSPFQIVIVDFLMPELNGEALARQIKAHPELQDTCLVMLTAAGNPSTENAMVKECFSAYLAKPIRIGLFIEKLAVIWGMYQNGYRDTLIKTDSFPLIAKETEIFTPLTGISILLAEDSRINQAFALDVLEQLSCTVRVVINGEEALRALQEEKFNLVLMDCQMPVMDGFEASRQIVALKKSGVLPADLPVIALTANAMEGDREKCLAAGMDDYLSKPVRAKELRQKVYHWLHITESMHVVQEPAAMPSDNKSESQAGKDMIVDPESIENAQKILKDKYEDMLGFFFEDTQTYINEIIAAFEAQRFTDGIRPAHTIKSTSLRMGAVKLSGCAKELEQILKSHENDNFSAIDRQTLDRYLFHLRQIFDQTKPLLSSKK